MNAKRKREGARRREREIYLAKENTQHQERTKTKMFKPEYNTFHFACNLKWMSFLFTASVYSKEGIKIYTYRF